MKPHLDCIVDPLTERVTDNGWFCPDSPDHACHYFTEDGLVVLTSGDRIQPPPEHDVTGETEDICIFCGLPEERK